MTIRLRVADLLKEKGISTGKLSRGADIPLSTVQRMVKDPNYQPRMETLVKTARFLEVAIEDLYYDDNA